MLWVTTEHSPRLVAGHIHYLRYQYDFIHHSNVAIGARSIPLVKVIIASFYPFAKPVGMFLDYVLGQEVGTIFTKKELWKILDIHVKQDMIDDDESWIMYGALHYKSKRVDTIMTPMDKVYMLPATALLDTATIRDIYQRGFSRIPVWQESTNNIIGLLYTKDLVFIDPEV
jgi:metal transporter CNNM